MSRDMRDPQALGERLLRDAPHARSAFALPEHPISLSEVYDVHVAWMTLPDYRDEDTIAKYGRPQDIPSTLPN